VHDIRTLYNVTHQECHAERSEESLVETLRLLGVTGLGANLLLFGLGELEQFWGRFQIKRQ
jgi:hypothetical protein